MKNLCQAPRPNTLDMQGSQGDEKGFIRAHTQETYLWASEVPTSLRATDYATVLDYFNVLKTPLLTSSGKLKDRFHFTYASDVWDALLKGVEFGYGITWEVGDNRIPRAWRVGAVEPGSPALAAGMRRGDLLSKIDGVDFVNRGEVDVVNAFNAALTPKTSGEQHRFTVLREGVALDLLLTAGSLEVPPVQNVNVIDTPTGKVGYMIFNSFNTPSEKQLFDAMQTFKAAAVSDLVIDMRYNGGGQLSVASELAYMIAGPSATAGKIFQSFLTNGVLSSGSPVTFQQRAGGLSVPNGTPLPYLSLNHVTVLTGPGTCSASEAVINGLRGIDIDVTLVGGQTCGKPYAFVPMPNCGTTYFTVQYQGLNNKGFGDFSDGFAPNCSLPDDLNHAQGDPAEGLLAAALRLRAGGACAPASGLRQGGRASMAAAPSNEPQVAPRPQAKDIAVLPERR